MPSLDETLDEVLGVDGVEAAAVIDEATGMVVRSAGEVSPGLPAAAASMADETRLARRALGPARPGGELDWIVTFTSGRLHLTRVLTSQPGESLLLFADLDRGRANLALASLRIGRLAPAILALADEHPGASRRRGRPAPFAPPGAEGLRR